MSGEARTGPLCRERNLALKLDFSSPSEVESPGREMSLLNIVGTQSQKGTWRGDLHNQHLGRANRWLRNLVMLGPWVSVFGFLGSVL